MARRFDPELDVFLVADAMRPVQAQAGFTILPNYCFLDRPAMVLKSAIEAHRAAGTTAELVDEHVDNEMSSCAHGRSVFAMLGTSRRCSASRQVKERLGSD